MRCHSITLAALLFVACAKPGAGTAASGSSSAVGNDACSPTALGLGAAKQLQAWKPPAGCRQTRASGDAPRLLRTSAELEAAFECDAATKLDIAAQTLVVAQRTMSPASMGTAVFDDGKVVTLVERSRRNCPNDPLPMPMSYTLAFLLPTGAERQFKELSCTMPTQCD